MSSSRSATSTLPPPRGTALVHDAQTLELRGALPIGGPDGDIAATGDAVWISSCSDRAVRRISPVALAETAVIGLSGAPCRLAACGTTLYVLTADRRVLRLDAGRLSETDSSPVLGPGPVELAVSARGVWVLSAEPDRCRLIKLHPLRLQVELRIDLGVAGSARGLRTGDGSVALLVESDPATITELVFDEVTGTPVPTAVMSPRACDLGQSLDSRWIRQDLRLQRISRSTGEVQADATLPGPQPGAALMAFGSIWTCDAAPPEPATHLPS